MAGLSVSGVGAVTGKLLALGSEHCIDYDGDNLTVHLQITRRRGALSSTRLRWRQAITAISLLFAVEVGVCLIPVPIGAA